MANLKVVYNMYCGGCGLGQNSNAPWQPSVSLTFEEGSFTQLN